MLPYIIPPYQNCTTSKKLHPHTVTQIWHQDICIQNIEMSLWNPITSPCTAKNIKSHKKRNVVEGRRRITDSRKRTGDLWLAPEPYQLLADDATSKKEWIERHMVLPANHRNTRGEKTIQKKDKRKPPPQADCDGRSTDTQDILVPTFMKYLLNIWCSLCVTVTRQMFSNSSYLQYSLVS